MQVTERGPEALPCISLPFLCFYLEERKAPVCKVFPFETTENADMTSLEGNWCRYAHSGLLFSFDLSLSSQTLLQLHRKTELVSNRKSNTTQSGQQEVMHF